MPKFNLGKGGKRHKKKKKGGRGNKTDIEIDPENGIMYAYVTKRPGGNYLDVMGADGKTRKCHISGKFWKRVYCNKGDIVIISLRDNISINESCDLLGKPDQNNVKRNLTKEEKKIFYGDDYKTDIFDHDNDDKEIVSSIWTTENNDTNSNTKIVTEPTGDNSNKFLNDENNETKNDELEFDFDLI